ncbi:MAG: hypothetical protein AAF497_11860 [Planctomycetota bacterium]
MNLQRVMPSSLGATAMKFTTRQLLLLPVVFLLNSWLVGHFAFSPLRHYRWQIEPVQLSGVQTLVEVAIQHCHESDVIANDETFQDYFDNRMPPDHPAANMLMCLPRTDVWGNPYRVAARDNPDHPPRIYSTGMDGQSNSNGYDPDDIRNWDQDGLPWYSNRERRRETSFCMLTSAAITGIGFWLMTRTIPTEPRKQ